MPDNGKRVGEGRRLEEEGAQDAQNLVSVKNNVDIAKNLILKEVALGLPMIGLKNAYGRITHVLY